MNRSLDFGDLVRPVVQFISRSLRKSPKAGWRVANGTLLLTHAEVCDRHGTGALLGKIFASDPALIVWYSHNFFGENSTGLIAEQVRHPNSDLTTAKLRVAPLLKDLEIKRILCVPFYPDDILSALAAAELTGAPLATYIMDDQNLFAAGIPDDLIRMLLARSAIRFAISEALRSGYQEKFGFPISIIPPTNSQSVFASIDLAAPNHHPPRGVMIGNVWSAEVVADLRNLIKNSGFVVDWFGNAGKPFVQLDPDELKAEGIILRGNVPEPELVRELRTFDYAIMPSAALNGNLEHDWLFRASLPSRLIYLMTTACLPVAVLGDPETAAGQFVERFDLGGTASYKSAAFKVLVHALTNPERATQIRRRAAALAPTFASESVADFIWRSMEVGRAVDDRYEQVFPRSLLHKIN